ncbi:aldolase [bacterium]|jgi:2-keto-3-deoxy-L-rhamnonate aldolase RhmA|nr:aldolase [bacterium]MDT1986249.1 aldolase/citrate lyase family protein [Planktomarina sp.]MDV3050334.1 aldolase/citrate lyase family protein [Planktomarina sp.]|tara:strand:- start:204 stop:968 length:765 start_codon:yes stop_codon:yes gene_type:complete
MRIQSFKSRMASRAMMAGTFLKTPAYELVEVLATSDLDFICIDMEHSPFDRGRADACLAVARALDFPVLVRVSHFSSETVLQALDMGAVGIVAPHITSAAQATNLAKLCHFGNGGRGFAGATRWAGYGKQTMSEVLSQSARETVVVAQIEEPEALTNVEKIAAVDGIDGLFLGPSDMSVSMGHTDTNSLDLLNALKRTGDAAKKASKAYMTFVPNAAKAADWAQYGAHMFFVGSEHGWMKAGANSDASGIHRIT